MKRYIVLQQLGEDGPVNKGEKFWTTNFTADPNEYHDDGTPWHKIILETDSMEEASNACK